MKNTNNIFFISLYTFLFSLLIFLGQGIFFPDSLREEKYIEISPWDTYLDLVSWNKDEYTSFSWASLSDTNAVVQDLLYEKYKEKYSELQKSKVQLRYIPWSLASKVEYSYAPLVESFMYHESILPQIDSIWIFMYQNIADTRGRMKSKNIHMYGVLERTDEEFVAVMSHEFAHYQDIYSFGRTAFGDVSQRFYDISWNAVSTIKPWLDIQDFVSWYAMTNQYEDFAETYTYYMFHNDDFLYKAQESTLLAQKYIFLREYVFKNELFVETDFSIENEVESYYWDITKISFDVKKFLQYMKDGI